MLVTVSNIILEQCPHGNPKEYLFIFSNLEPVFQALVVFVLLIMKAGKEVTDHLEKWLHHGSSQLHQLVVMGPLRGNQPPLGSVWFQK